MPDGERVKSPPVQNRSRENPPDPAVYAVSLTDDASMLAIRCTAPGSISLFSALNMKLDRQIEKPFEIKKGVPLRWTP